MQSPKTALFFYLQIYNKALAAKSTIGFSRKIYNLQSKIYNKASAVMSKVPFRPSSSIIYYLCIPVKYELLVSD